MSNSALLLFENFDFFSFFSIFPYLRNALNMPFWNGHNFYVTIVSEWKIMFYIGPQFQQTPVLHGIIYTLEKIWSREPP